MGARSQIPAANKERTEGRAADQAERRGPSPWSLVVTTAAVRDALLLKLFCWAERTRLDGLFVGSIKAYFSPRTLRDVLFLLLLLLLLLHSSFLSSFEYVFNYALLNL